MDEYDLIAEAAEAGSREFGRSAGDVLLQRGLEIDNGVSSELARLFLDNPQEALIIKFFERRPSLGETFVAIGCRGEHHLQLGDGGEPSGPGPVGDEIEIIVQERTEVDITYRLRSGLVAGYPGHPAARQHGCKGQKCDDLFRFYISRLIWIKIVIFGLNTIRPGQKINSFPLHRACKP